MTKHRLVSLSQERVWVWVRVVQLVRLLIGRKRSGVGASIVEIEDIGVTAIC
ncbi:hypothetical protein PILCRDRAFT_820659 [Piloderma croceum F 1598]|uniref:Uncharacterized protein n=1 Tax=Piloderma croceum (strain F 1598) TaxID=765440 RepID=A0A0C3FRD1_PILCF|nr:hypothetical protein PILCRDRAFT_820659 [Piloderma croceum F 1598]